MPALRVSAGPAGVRDTILVKDSHVKIEDIPVPDKGLEDAGRNSPAKTEMKHLTFKGIPVDGTPEAFLLALKAKGFRVPQALPSGRFFATGEFAGEPDVLVLVSSKEFFVWKVTVLFPSKPSWAFVKEQYERFKRSYAEKFGVEPSCDEKLSPRYKEGSGNEVWGFESGDSRWRSTFHFPEGTVTLSVGFDNHDSKMHLVIDYVDYLNYIVKREYEISDL